MADAISSAPVRAPVAFDVARLSAIADEVARAPGSSVERMQALRRAVLAEAEGRLPASAAEAYAGALARVARGAGDANGGAAVGAVALRATLAANDRGTGEVVRSIEVARRDVRSLDTELARLSKDNLARFEASRAAFQAIRDQLVKVFTDSHRHEHDRVGAFFQIYAKNQKEEELVRSFRAYEKKQGELRELLQALRDDEAKLTAENGGGGELGSADDRAKRLAEDATRAANRGEGSVAEPRRADGVGRVDGAARADGVARADLALVVLARRKEHLEALLANLEAQVALLRDLVRHAAGTNHALAGVSAALEQELTSLKSWIAATEADTVNDLLGFVGHLAGFVAEVAGGPAAAAAASIARLLASAILQDVDGVRAEAESLVFRTLARLVTAGLVDAGVTEGLSRTLVASLRGLAGAAISDDRRAARDLVTAAVRAGLGEAQRSVVDFLLQDASDALPIASLVKSVLADPGLTMGQAATLIEHLRHPARPVAGTSALDAALELLRASVA